MDAYVCSCSLPCAHMIVFVYMCKLIHTVFFTKTYLLYFLKMKIVSDVSKIFVFEILSVYEYALHVCFQPCDDVTGNG